jgi:hypothetical protein
MATSDTKMSATLREPPRIGEAVPKVRETLSHASDVASDFYSKATSWLGEHSGPNYGWITLAAVTGVVGFFVGRSLRESPLTEI